MDKKLGLASLTALIISSMIGAGIFSLPQNMAAVASPAAIIIAWLITGVGMISLALSLQYLSITNPHINTGIFGYAKHGFGRLTGFCSAWAYWVSATFTNISYLVIICATLGLLFDTSDLVIFGVGNNAVSIIVASIFLWMIHIFISNGIQTAAFINLLATFAKLLSLFIFIILALLAFHWDTFMFDFHGAHFGKEYDLFSQVKATMLITVWVFIGIEGAVVLSNRARHRKHIGFSTILALLTTILIYVLVTLTSMGVIQSVELAKYPNPSTAKILTSIMGPLGQYIIGIGLIISVCSSFLSWLIYATEVPYSCAKDKLFPETYRRVNANGTPIRSLIFTTIAIQVSLIFVMCLDGTYDSLYRIASEMILVPYLLVGIYTLKFAIKQENLFGIVLGFLSTSFGIWLLYASGLQFFIMSAVLYLPGLYFFIKSQREQNIHLFKGKERIIVGLLLIAALIGLKEILNGTVL
ncbi:basic amino acid/polyamine antiporter [Candidatus Photodesmus anomalopis]|uniref:Arginine/ornithine antiporter n=1 Tax=Candidatus Photodesmus katoptron Akat1 TaxID=1236703 RepID=S3DIN1_9GAMM|nr:basic amino acid/polyamine antiporter [Candidatus Photodesmus katoptron]EPE37585.1 arginine/ornithine antiporter [Candidatus Photodesmus katoptron Akat1]